MQITPHIYTGLPQESQRQIWQKTAITDPETIMKVVAKESGISLNDIKSHSRKRTFLDPRIIAMLLIKERTDLILSQIGNLFGERNHSTVLSAIRSAKDLLYTDKEFRELFERINIKLWQGSQKSHIIEMKKQ